MSLSDQRVVTRTTWSKCAAGERAVGVGRHASILGRPGSACDALSRRCPAGPGRERGGAPWTRTARSGRRSWGGHGALADLVLEPAHDRGSSSLHLGRPGRRVGPHGEDPDSNVTGVQCCGDVRGRRSPASVPSPTRRRRRPSSPGRPSSVQLLAEQQRVAARRGAAARRAGRPICRRRMRLEPRAQTLVPGSGSGALGRRAASSTSRRAALVRSSGSCRSPGLDARRLVGCRHSGDTGHLARGSPRTVLRSRRHLRHIGVRRPR